MASEFRTRRIVEFAETDMAGILHFSNYYRYMEMTEHAFFRALGFSVHSSDPGGAWGAARARAECTFKAPLRYEDVVELHLMVRRIGNKSIDYEVVFYKVDPAAPADRPATDEVARGTMTVVFVGKPDDQSLRAVPVPAAAASALEVHPG